MTLNLDEIFGDEPIQINTAASAPEPVNATAEPSAEPVPESWPPPGSQDWTDPPPMRLLCSPPSEPFDPDRLRRVLAKCDRCGHEHYIDTPIHDGKSTRRDCARCNRFMGWPLWYGSTN